jgi:hypothetical protein
MTHVLPMATLELGHPVPFLILVETGDPALHPITRPQRRIPPHAERAATLAE